MKNQQLDRIELMLRQVLENQASLAGNQIRVAEAAVGVGISADINLDKVRVNSGAIIEITRQCLES